MLLTREFLESIGVELDDAGYELLAEHFETTLHERVINEVVEGLTPTQAEELARLQTAEDSQLYVWLQKNVTDLAEIVRDEVDILLGEVAQDSEKL